MQFPWGHSMRVEGAVPKPKAPMGVNDQVYGR